MLAADQLGQVLALLLRVRPAADLVDAQVGVRAVTQPHRARGARYLLLRDDMLEIAEAKSAILLLHGDAVEPELTHLRPQVARELVSRVDLGGDRVDLVLGEAPRRLADRVGHFAQAKVETGFTHRKSSRRAPLAERQHG